MIYSGSGDLPHHLYVHVDSSFIRTTTGFEPAVWFGLASKPGEMWGCHVMLECGAVYRNVPPHAIAFKPDPCPWEPTAAQLWDCYGPQFSTHEYAYLKGLDAQTKTHLGRYLFTAIPLFDGYTRAPDQSKEFMFLALDNGRLTIQPTDKVLFHDKSFTEPDWPMNIKRQTDTYSCE